MRSLQDMRMASLAFSTMFICTFLATVCCQKSVVSTSTIRTGQTFSFYCDSTRVATPTGVESIYSLTLNRTVTGGNSVQLARYLSVVPTNTNPEIKNPPTGRQWDFTFSGANGGSNNIASMNIVVDVSDTQCSDAGVYYCEIVYFYAGGGTSPPVSSPGENVTASVGIYNFALTADPDLYDYEVDDNVTFTCTTVGPSAAVTFTWVLHVNDQSGWPFQQTFPNNAVLVTNTPTLQPNDTGCQQYSWVSTLSIRVPPSHRFQLYICTIDDEHIGKSFMKIISVIPRRTQTSTSLPQNCTTPSSQAVALRKRRTPSAWESALLLLASILLVKHPYVLVLPVSFLSCLIVGAMCV